MKQVPLATRQNPEHLLLKRLVERGDVLAVLQHLNQSEHPTLTPGMEHENFTTQISPVGLAARLGHTNVMSALIASGFDPHELSATDGCPRRAPIHFACQEGQLEVVKTLVTQYGVDADSRDGFRCTSLYIAVCRGKMEIAKFLVESGASVNDPYDDVNQTSLLHLTVNGRQVEMCRFLVRRGANVDARDKWKVSPLHLAAQHGYDDILTVLLEGGADVNIKDSTCFTPVMCAVANRHLTTLKLLVSCGGDPEAEDECGSSVLNHALLTSREDIVRYLLVTRNVSPRRKDQRFMNTYLQDRQDEDNVKDILDICKNAGYDIPFVNGRGSRISARSLLNICCFKIRRTCGKILPERVENLPLPILLKEFVQLTHLQNLS